MVVFYMLRLVSRDDVLINLKSKQNYRHTDRHLASIKKSLPIVTLMAQCTFAVC